MAIINNTASATYNYGRSEVGSAVSNTATTNLLEEFSITGSKLSNNQTFRNGENITYQVSVTNDGIDSLYNVTISDDLGGIDNPLTFLEGSLTYSVNGITSVITPTSVRPLEVVLPTPLAAGETATIVYVARVSSGLAEDVETIVNTATITANEGSETGAVISVTPSPSNTIIRADFAELSLTKSVSSMQISSGEEFSYTITLSNSGNLDATGVIITDDLPNGFVISSIVVETNGSTTTFTEDDYTVDPTTNTLTLPTGGTLSIMVPAAFGGVAGTSLITITGSIN